MYIFSPSKIKQTFYVSVCSVEGTLATDKINFFVNVNRQLDFELALSVTKVLVFRLTAVA